VLVKPNLRWVFKIMILNEVKTAIFHLFNWTLITYQFENPCKQFLMVNIKDCDNNFVKPRLPNNYKPNQASNYSHNGYLFNLEPGDYTIILVSYLLSTQAPGVVDGRKWLIRTVSPHASLAKLE